MQHYLRPIDLEYIKIEEEQASRTWLLECYEKLTSRNKAIVQKGRYFLENLKYGKTKK